MAQSYAKRRQQKMYSEEKTKWAWKKTLGMGFSRHEKQNIFPYV